MRRVTRENSAAAASRLAASSPPTTCGSSSSSRRAWPWIVRSGANARRTLAPQRPVSSGNTTLRLAPTGTVERTITRVSGPHRSATWRAAARRFSSSGAWVTGLVGVETQIITASTPSGGSSRPTCRRSPRNAARPSSTPGSKRCARPSESAARTAGEASTPWTVRPLRARATAMVRPTYPMPTTPTVFMRLVQPPFGDVAVGLAQVVGAAHVEPVLADHVRGDRVVALEARTDQIGGVEVLPGWDQVDERGIEQIDPGINRELFSRLLLHPADARALQRELPVRDVHLVERDAHRHAGPLRAMELPHRVEVTLGEDVAVDDEERVDRPRAKEGQGADGAEALGLVHVREPHAEARAVAELGPDHVGPVVHRHHHVAHPATLEALDEELDEGPPAHPQQRLRRLLGERPEPGA